MNRFNATPAAKPAAQAPEAPHLRAASAACRRELAALDLDIVVRARRVDIDNPSTNLLRRAALRAGFKRFDEAATVPGTL